MTTASRKTATQFDTRADKLNPGQHIRTPTGGTTQVRRVRNHESSGKHVYVDTDLGTTVVPREDAFEVVPQNARQQESPGYGTPGGNSNTLPFDPHGPGGSNTSTSSSCPVCGTSGSLRRSGDHYTCSKCGYQENFGGPADKNYSSSTQVIRTFTNKNNNRRTASVIAQRARQVLDLEENQ
jgi:ribosomal protein L37AE/L43A